MGYWRWLLLAVAIAGLDQVTKLWAESALHAYDSVELLPVLSLTLGYNTGAAFSLLGEAAGWQRWVLAAVALGVSLYLIYWLRQLGTGYPRLSLGLALILAGALGNLIDRLRLGYVVDFIHLHYAGFHWPLFNVADIGITLGAALVIAIFLFADRSKPVA
ncbi:MAG: signal peptidase II [Halorhodospira sp.]